MSGRKRFVWLKRVTLVLLLVFAGLSAKAWHDTMRDPVIRRADVALAGLAPQTSPMTVLVMSDLHVAGPDMPPSRLARIVAQANALNPDIVVLTGDLISDRRMATSHYTLAEAVAPLSALRPRMGTAAVLGNHDHWRNAVVARAELSKTGATVMANSATRIGPITVAGLDDDFSHHADVPATVQAMRKLGGPYVAISHSPDPFPDLPGDVRLMFAGHTHCGQIRLPVVGAPAYMSRYGKRFACGRIDENGRTLFVTAGLGTSVLPFRFGVVPDMWLVTIRPAQTNPAHPIG